WHLHRSSGDSNIVAAETAGAQARFNPPATFHRGLPRFQRTLIIPAPLLNPSGHSEASHLPSGLRHRPRDGSVVSSPHCMNDPQPEGHMASYIARRKFLANAPVGETPLVVTTARDLALRRAMLPERRTGATLGDVQLRSHLLNAGTATRGA